MRLFVAYLLAFATVAWITPLLFLPLSWGVVWLLRKKTPQTLIAAIDVLVRFVSVLLVVWLCGRLSVDPELLMILAPAFFVTRNDLDRIREAEKGMTFTARQMEAMGEKYDQAAEIRVEWLHLIGDVVGWVIGIFYFMPNVDFGLLVLHVGVAFIGFLILLNDRLHGRWRRQTEYVLGAGWLLLLAIAFIAFGWNLGMLTLIFSFVYGAILSGPAARLARRILGY